MIETCARRPARRELLDQQQRADRARRAEFKVAIRGTRFGIDVDDGGGEDHPPHARLAPVERELGAMAGQGRRVDEAELFRRPIEGVGKGLVVRRRWAVRLVDHATAAVQIARIALVEGAQIEPQADLTPAGDIADFSMFDPLRLHRVEGTDAHPLDLVPHADHFFGAGLEERGCAVGNAR